MIKAFPSSSPLTMHIPGEKFVYRLRENSLRMCFECLSIILLPILYNMPGRLFNVPCHVQSNIKSDSEFHLVEVTRGLIVLQVYSRS